MYDNNDDDSSKYVDKLYPFLVQRPHIDNKSIVYGYIEFVHKAKGGRQKNSTF